MVAKTKGTRAETATKPAAPVVATKPAAPAAPKPAAPAATWYSDGSRVESAAFDGATHIMLPGTDAWAPLTVGKPEKAPGKSPEAAIADRLAAKIAANGGKIIRAGKAGESAKMIRLWADVAFADGLRVAGNFSTKRD